jgi:2-oxoglutarate ferredoxin oxidoreductase subunit gamma
MIENKEIIVAGAGGQGIISAGKFLAYIFMNLGQHVTCMPSYGAEVRGGAAKCIVKISTELIASPVLDKPDVGIIMNDLSLVHFIKKIKKGGLIILNSSLISESKKIRKDLKVIKGPFTDMAMKLGNVIVANVIALGAFFSVHNYQRDKIDKYIRGFIHTMPENIINLNRKALELAYEIFKS